MCSVVIHVTRWSFDSQDNLPWHPRIWVLLSRPLHLWTHPSGIQRSHLTTHWQQACGSLSGRAAQILSATGFSLTKSRELDSVGDVVWPLDTDKNHEACAECIKIKLPNRVSGVGTFEHFRSCARLLKFVFEITLFPAGNLKYKTSARYPMDRREVFAFSCVVPAISWSQSWKDIVLHMLALIIY